MAQQLTQFTFPCRGSREKYRRYLDGAVWKLDPSDYAPAQVASVRVSIAQLAARCGMKVRTSVLPTGALVVQAYRDEPADASS